MESNLVGLLARLRRPGWSWDPWKGVLKNDALGLHVSKSYLIEQRIYEEERLHGLLLFLELGGRGGGDEPKRATQHLRELMRLSVRRGWTWDVRRQALVNAALKLVVSPEQLAALGIQDENGLQDALLAYEQGMEGPLEPGSVERDGDPPHQGSIKESM